MKCSPSFTPTTQASFVFLECVGGGYLGSQPLATPFPLSGRWCPGVAVKFTLANEK